MRIGLCWHSQYTLPHWQFSAVLMVPDTNVGGYYNTALDLCFNGLGAVVAVVIIALFGRKT